MGTIRWAILAAVLILIIIFCKLNFHQRHFNLFILVLFLLNYVAIVFFWLTCRWQDPVNSESIK